MAVIKKPIIKNNQVDTYVMRGGQSLTPKQVAQKVEKGEKVIFKGREVQSVDGEHVRSKPDGTKKNNIIPKK